MVKIQTEPFRKVPAATAVEICDRMDLSSDARAYLLPSLSPQGFLALLVEAEQVGDAIRFMAFALPIREGVWWACVNAHAALPDPSDKDATCLERAASWVYEPTDERRRSCMSAAEASNFEGAAAYAALAAFWSGGSLAPEGMPDAPADPTLGPIGVGASVLLSITRGDPLALEDRFRAAIARGADIANGGNGRREGDRPIQRAS